MKDKTAKAYPTKAFFVNMITRDITLEDSILDLIDNSIDGALRCEGNPPIALTDDIDLSKYKIELTVSPAKFCISDNCGGMSLDEAADYAFTFGRRGNGISDNYGIGVYGIGMKRAAFKLGKKIDVFSTFPDKDGKTSFVVPIPVDEWIKSDKPPWDFDIDSAEHLENHGVKIIVEELNTEARISFDNPEFVEDLRRIIGRDYSLHLNSGLSITVNEQPIDGMPIRLRTSNEIIPMRKSFEYEVGDDGTSNGGKVSIEIIAGMSAPPPESPEPDEKAEGESGYGWYVACNGRIVLAADRTNVAGWGTPDWPQWHYQYAGFFGIVLFTSENASLLPLTTTKRSVDVSSEIFLKTRLHMRDVSKRWIAYTNERKRDLAKAKEKENLAEVVSLQDVKINSVLELPTVPKRIVERRANVHYSVPIARMNELADAFGSIQLPYREVGLRSFDFAYDELVEEE